MKENLRRQQWAKLPPGIKTNKFHGFKAEFKSMLHHCQVIIPQQSQMIRDLQEENSELRAALDDNALAFVHSNETQRDIA